MKLISNKTFLKLSILTILNFAYINSQESLHTHNGFYFNFNLGFSNGFTTMTDDKTNAKVKLSGWGGEMELRLGYTILENIILNINVSSSGTENVKFNTYSNGPYNFLDTVIDTTNSLPDGSPINPPILDTTLHKNEYRGGELFCGVGLVYYLMPQNIQFSIILGGGLLTMENKNDLSEGMNSQFGPGFKLSFGKEFWISKNWGLGASAGYSFLSTKDDRFANTSDYRGHGYLNRFTIFLNATYN